MRTCPLLLLVSALAAQGCAARTEPSPLRPKSASSSTPPVSPTPPASAAPRTPPRALRFQHAYEHPERLELLAVTPEMAQATCEGIPIGQVFEWIDKRPRSEATEPSPKVKYVCPPAFVPLLEHRWGEMSCEGRLFAVNLLIATRPPLAWHALTVLLEDARLDGYRCVDNGLDARREATRGLIALSAEQPIPLERTLMSAALCGDDSNLADYYRVLGNSKETDALEHLRWLAARVGVSRHGAPRGDEVWALAAMIKLGGRPERRLFSAIVSSLASAGGDTTDAAHVIGRQLTYIGDPRLARAMLPWLDRHDRPTNHGVVLDSLAEYAVDQATRMGIDTGSRHRASIEAREPPDAIEATRRSLGALPPE